MLTVAAAPTPPPAPVAKPKIGLGPRERRELEALPERIEKAENQAAAIEARLAEPAVASDPAQLQQLCSDLAAAHAAIETLYARWTELEAKAGG